MAIDKKVMLTTRFKRFSALLTAAQRGIIQPVAFIMLFLSSGCKDDDVIIYRIPKETRETAESSLTGAARLLTPTWEAPADWASQELEPDAVRKAAWRVSNAETSTEAEVTVVSFPGEAGGPLANVTRWRRQIGLEPLSPEALASEGSSMVSVDGVEAFYTFLEGLEAPEGSSQPQSILACSVKPGAYTWFFKMKGDATLVAAQQETFRAFLKTVRFMPVPLGPSVDPELSEK